MGRVIVRAKIESIPDLLYAEKGIIGEREVHRLEIPDALVDTGATTLSMPRSKIEELGFTKPFTMRTSRTAKGPMTSNIYGPVRLCVQDRFCNVDISEIEEGNPVLIGQVPLELMDFIVDPVGQRLVGNPDHGGQWMQDLFRSR